jgi:hypothetical protein
VTRRPQTALVPTHSRRLVLRFDHHPILRLSSILQCSSACPSQVSSNCLSKPSSEWRSATYVTLCVYNIWQSSMLHGNVLIRGQLSIRYTLLHLCASHAVLRLPTLYPVGVWFARQPLTRSLVLSPLRVVAPSTTRHCLSATTHTSLCSELIIGVLIVLVLWI